VTESTLRIERLGADAARALSAMTFPAYRHLLSLEPAPRQLDMGSRTPIVPIAVGAFAGPVALGLARAELRPGEPPRAEVLSLFVAPDARGKGLGTALLAALTEELAREGAADVEAVYMTGQPAQPAIERVLARCGFPEPTRRMLTVRMRLDDVKKADWYGRYRLGPEYEIFAWKDLRPEERSRLRETQEATGWIKPDLVPWNWDEDGWEPVSSVGVRKDGEVVGWVLNHAISDRVVRFTCSFIRRDLGRRGRIVPAYTESARRAAEKFQELTFTVPTQHEGMSGFLTRWCAPFSTFSGETRGTKKSFS
jgi:GNAT superfamily N-acetyltransferase